MKLSVTWVTPREYSTYLDAAEVLSRIAGSRHESQVRRLLSQLEVGSALNDDDVALLAAVIGDHSALLPEDDSNWISTGESEITHVQAIRTAR